MLQLLGERNPGNWEPRSTTKSRCTIILIQEIYWEKHRRMAASAWKQLGLKELGPAIMALEYCGDWGLVVRGPQPGHFSALRGLQ